MRKCAGEKEEKQVESFRAVNVDSPSLKLLALNGPVKQAENG